MLDYGKGFFTLSHDRKRFGIYDAETNRLKIGAVGAGAGPGGRVGEGYDFCHLPDREEVLVLWSPAKDKPCETWSYSFKNNAWTNLKAANPPPHCEVGRVEYVPEQQVAYAVIKPREGASPQWAYSLKHNAWKEVTAPQAVRSNGPMTQVAYSAKYGVFVWYGWGGTSLMRPDFSQVKWE